MKTLTLTWYLPPSQEHLARFQKSFPFFFPTTMWGLIFPFQLRKLLLHPVQRLSFFYKILSTVLCDWHMHLLYSPFPGEEEHFLQVFKETDAQASTEFQVRYLCWSSVMRNFSLERMTLARQGTWRLALCLVQQGCSQNVLMRLYLIPEYNINKENPEDLDGLL